MNQKATQARVAAYCAVTGTTKDELARDLGMTRQTLHSKLTGETEFKLSEAVQLSKILGCDVDELTKIPTFD